MECNTVNMIIDGYLMSISHYELTKITEGFIVEFTCGLDDLPFMTHIEERTRENARLLVPVFTIQSGILTRSKCELISLQRPLGGVTFDITLRCHDDDYTIEIIGQ